MMTLKDIKISRNRPNVQNALWLKPTGGLSFRIYYPHGGEWAEMNIDGSSPSPTPTPTPVIEEIEKQILEIKQDLSEFHDEYTANQRTVTRKLRELTNLQERVSALSLSVDKLYNSVDIVGIEFSKAPNIGGSEIFIPTQYGIGSAEWNSLINDRVRRATIPGYESAFEVSVEELTTPSLFISHWLTVRIGLKENTKRTVFTIIGTIQTLVGTTPEVVYYIDGEEQLIDNSTIFLGTELFKESRQDVTTEQMAEIGFSPAVIEGIYSGQITKILMNGNYLNYIITDVAPPEDNPYSEFHIYAYDGIHNETLEYEVYGTLSNGVWTYEFVYTTVSGDLMPEEEQESEGE